MYDKEQGLIIASNDKGNLCINGKMANRHGLIAGATGTGKTVTLQTMAETFCQAGVPCFMADMKGDLSGISQGCPARFYDVYGEQGHPMRATVSQMGPQLLSRLLGLNDTQDGVLNIVFRIADERGLLILDMKDLRSMLDYVSRNARQYTSHYGNIAPQTIGAIQRALLQIEAQGAEHFFGEPAFDIHDLLATVPDDASPAGRKGMMSILAADKLMLQPKLYSTFLLWLLSELYTTMPEVGDLPLPKLVFFFDEAHMLFEGTSKALLDKIEQVIRLIRSKGVGIYFVTQNPTDIPDVILGQLGNRVQHALRAYTPKDQKAVKAAAETFRANTAFSTYDTITSLSTGEALISFLDEKGAPNIVERAKVVFPQSQVGAITETQRKENIHGSSIYGKYDNMVDRISAYEQLVEEDNALAEAKESAETKKPQQSKKAQKQGIMAKVWKAVLTAVTSSLAAIVGSWVSEKVSGKSSKSRTSAKEKVVKNATSAATRTITRELTRDILGNLTK